MRTPLYFLVYNLIISPLLIVGSHLAALVHPKVRSGVLGRYRTLRWFYREMLPQFANHSGPRVLIHCASMGEFEHIKPMIVSLKERQPNARIVVMFFSPSGYENVRQFPGVDAFLYAPFDWFPLVFRLFQRLRPALFIIAKHDVWPNQLWSAALLRVPIFLVNASLGKKSRRARRPFRWFHQTIYQYFTRILAISETDAANFRHLAQPRKVVVVGDTKFDQVIWRSQESRKKTIIPPQIVSRRPVFVAGSTWPEDEAVLIPAIRALLEKVPDVLTILVPHEPTPAHLNELAQALGDLAHCRLSSIQHYQEQPVIVVDSIGVLANLYSLAHVAFVGGSFKGSIHNVLEPAVYGIPVLFGPHYQNSHEAMQLHQLGSGIVVQNVAEMTRELLRLFTDSEYRQAKGQLARQFVEHHQGATQRVVEWLFKYLPR